MERPSRVTARELRDIRQDPSVAEAVARYRRAARDWAGQIAVLEVRRDRDLGRLEQDVEAAEVEALTRLREQARAATPAEVEPSRPRRRGRWSHR